jgi:lipopolysaccharide export LptBFGC system permease protein LptF
MAKKEQPYEQKHAIQAKRYQEGNNVGGPSIAEYSALTDQFDADATVVVTTSDYTSDAQERGETLGVKLINGEDLADIVEQYNAHDLLDYYSETQEYSQAVPDPATGNTPTIEPPSEDDQQPTSQWWRVFLISGTVSVLCLVGAGLAVTTVLSQAETAVSLIAGALFLFGYVISTFCVYMDTSTLADSASDWDPDPILYTAAFLIIGLFFQFWFLCYLIYGYIRWTSA